MRYCIKEGTIVDPAGGFVGTGDVLIEDGKVAAVEKNINPGEMQIISAKNKLVFPGLIDLHCHLREPGREDEETIASGTKAALKGGFTAVTAMANTNPVADTAVAIEYIYKQAKAAGFAKVYSVGAVTKGLQGVELAEMGEMAAAGAVAFSDDGKTITNAAVFRTALEYSKLFGLPLLLHEEDPNLAGNGVMHEGYWSTVLGLPGIPSLAEDVMTARDLFLAEFTKARIHFCHVSTKGSAAMIGAAKNKGLAVTAEATPHHFTLTDEDLQGYDPNFRVSPPLRSKEDRDSIRKALQEEVIDVIATDHAPHTLEEKHREFALAPTGLIGLETALSLAWTELVLGGWLTKEQLVERMSAAPARILNKPGGCLTPDAPADLVIFDPELEWEVKAADFSSKSKNSPFIGRKLKGKVESVWVNGILKLEQGKIIE
ncbi:MAG: dihydroorotase [Bacteroidota bacterium]